MNMNSRKPFPMRLWVSRGLGALALAAGTVVAQPAFAASTAHITLYVTGAPSTAWVEVEWQNPVDSSWQVVTGWQGDLDYTDSGVAYKQWAVDQRDYGTGPFRWVVCVKKGGAVMATSQTFKLPTDSAANLVMTLNAATTSPVASTGAKPAATPAAASATPMTLSSWTKNEGFDAKGEAIARITMMIAPISPQAFVGVQYKDAEGVWQDVTGWQTGITINEKGVGVVQWAVCKRCFGNGPMRWIIYGAQGGAVVGVSPEFNLPTDVGVNFVMHLTNK
ncbi:MAG: hypothetical protein JNL73_00605 [Anaerolineales bacterium]|nr:hypothetical protein [Anaerolineales bacterium]